MRVIYTKNADFFKNIEAAETLYVLGLFAADGHAGQNRFRITLSAKDGELLEKIKILMDFNGEIRYVAEKHKNGIRIGRMAQLSICCKKIVDDLIKLGFTNNKTYDGFLLPAVSDSLMWHFIRGYFDGDGHFSYRNTLKATGKKRYSNKCYKFEICSKTDGCLRQIADFFKKHNISSRVRHDRVKEIFYLTCSGKNNTHKIFKYLYDNSTIHLKRKCEAFLGADFNRKIQGVYRYNDRFKCSIGKNKTCLFLGIYDTLEKASRIRDIAAILLNGQLTKLNDERNRDFSIEEAEQVRRRLHVTIP
jgi:hypothetical protein